MKESNQDSQLTDEQIAEHVAEIIHLRKQIARVNGAYLLLDEMIAPICERHRVVAVALREAIGSRDVSLSLPEDDYVLRKSDSDTISVRKSGSDRIYEYVNINVPKTIIIR